MKMLSALFAVGLLVGIGSVSKAQTMGNPWYFTITGNFIVGEPNATYLGTGGPPRVANVVVGAGATFTVKNTDSRTRTPATSYSVYTTLALQPNLVTVLPNGGPTNTSGTYSTAITAGTTVTLPGISYMCSGNEGVATYSATYLFAIDDDKTGDYLNQAASTPVQVL